MNIFTLFSTVTVIVRILSELLAVVLIRQEPYLVGEEA